MLCNITYVNFKLAGKKVWLFPNVTKAIVHLLPISKPVAHIDLQFTISLGVPHAEMSRVILGEPNVATVTVQHKATIK